MANSIQRWGAADRYTMWTDGFLWESLAGCYQGSGATGASHTEKCCKKRKFILPGEGEEGKTTPLIHVVVWSRHLQRLSSFVCQVENLTQTLRVQLLVPKVSLATLLSDLKVNGVALQMSSSFETNEDQIF